MLYDPRLKINTPESVVLNILASKPRISTKELFGFFDAKYKKKITIQGFYKLIKKMLENRILLKEGGLLLLDSFWINKLNEFSDLIKKNYLISSLNSSNVLLEEGESKKFEFESIVSMDNFWGHSLNTIKNFYTKNEHEDKNTYSRNYFSVFQVARTQSETETVKTFGVENMQWYMASGSNMFLNRIVSKLIENKNYHHFIYDFEKYEEEINLDIEKNFWETTIGDYIFEAKMPNYLFALIERMYEEVQSLSEFNADRLNYLFQEPGKSILTISHNKKRAEFIRKNVKALYKTYRKE